MEKTQKAELCKASHTKETAFPVEAAARAQERRGAIGLPEMAY
jgi:hypothetical protein